MKPSIEKMQYEVYEEEEAEYDQEQE